MTNHTDSIARAEVFIEQNLETLGTMQQQVGGWMAEGTDLGYSTIERIINTQARAQIARQMRTIIEFSRERGIDEQTIAEALLDNLRATLIHGPVGTSSNPVSNVMDMAMLVAVRHTMGQVFPGRV